MKTTFKKLALYSVIMSGSLFFILSSCRKEQPLKEETRKLNTISGSIQIDQSWINIRNKARREYDFYFASYYHKRDILKDVDWDHAIVSYDGNGNKVMVFLMANTEEMPTDARLMVIQKPGGATKYSIRLKSQDANYTSVYSANDKMLYVGTMQGDIFKPTGQMELKGTTVLGRSMCDGCHSGDGHDYPGGGGGGNPYPGSGTGGGSIWDNNLLDEVVIEDTYPDIVFPEQPNLWDGTIVVIPGGSDDNNVDNDPCAKFKALMANPDFRAKLNQLLNNTTLNVETAFTYNGTTFSPFAYGTTSNPQVGIDVTLSTRVWAHSHYSGLSPTFTPADLQSIYLNFNFVTFMMDYVAVVVTPYGIYMIKVIDQNKFNSFGAQYLSNQAGLDFLSGKYAQYGITMGTYSGDSLQDLLADLNSGLTIFKLPDPDDPNPPCN